MPARPWQDRRRGTGTGGTEMRSKGSKNGVRTLVTLVCTKCGQPFQVWPSQAANGRRKFCSSACAGRPNVPPAGSFEERNAKTRAHAQTDAQKLIAARRRAEQGDRYREARRDWMRRNAEHWREVNARWLERTRDERAEAARQRNEARRTRMIAAYGGECACCGITEPRFLTLDHTNGGGGNERRAINGGVGGGNSRIIVRLEREGWPQDGRYRILCWNCQWGWRMGGCPHQRAV